MRRDSNRGPKPQRQSLVSGGAIEYIAPEELALATLHMVEEQFGIAEDRVASAVARLFGVERLWSENAELIQAVIDDLVAKERLRRSGTQLHLA